MVFCVISSNDLALRDQFVELRESVEAITVQKEFYSTREVADLMGVTQHTVQVRWCSNERIEAEKDPVTGHWRIPGHEYERCRQVKNHERLERLSC